MKKGFTIILVLASFISYAQNNVYGKYIKAIDSLHVGSNVTSDGNSLTVDEVVIDGDDIVGTFDSNTSYILRTTSAPAPSAGISARVLLQSRGTDGLNSIYGNVSSSSSTYPALGFFAAQGSASQITNRPLFGFYDGYSTSAVSVLEIDHTGEFDFQANSLTDVGSLSSVGTEILDISSDTTILIDADSTIFNTGDVVVEEDVIVNGNLSVGNFMAGITGTTGALATSATSDIHTGSDGDIYLVTATTLSGNSSWRWYGVVHIYLASSGIVSVVDSNNITISLVSDRIIRLTNNGAIANIRYNLLKLQ